MAISAVMVLNAFHGISTGAWTWWVWFSVLIGVVLIWVYTVRRALGKTLARRRTYHDRSSRLFTPPSSRLCSRFPSSTCSFFCPLIVVLRLTIIHSGNDHYLFQSAYFWFGLIITFFISMLPRYVAKAYRVHYMPNDIDILRIVHKQQPYRDLSTDPLAGGRFTDDGLLKPLDTLEKVPTRQQTRRREEDDLYVMQQRPLPHAHPLAAVGSRTDMSTGLPMGTDRGFDFSTEEGGVAIRRIQTNLSERNQDLGKSKSTRRLGASRLIPSSIRRSLHRPRSRSIQHQQLQQRPTSSSFAEEGAPQSPPSQRTP